MYLLAVPIVRGDHVPPRVVGQNGSEEDTFGSDGLGIESNFGERTWVVVGRVDNQIGWLLEVGHVGKFAQIGADHF